MNPQQLAILLQAIQALGISPHTLAPRQPLQAQTRGPSQGRQTRADVMGRSAQSHGVPSAASSAYMSMARRIPAPGISRHDMNRGGMTKGKGAGNFGM